MDVEEHMLLRFRSNFLFGRHGRAEAEDDLHLHRLTARGPEGRHRENWMQQLVRSLYLKLSRMVIS